MFIVILGWLYVIAMVAIKAPSVWLGLFIFLTGGLAPVLLWLYVAGSRLRRARLMRRDDASAPADTSSDREPAPPSPPTQPH